MRNISLYLMNCNSATHYCSYETVSSTSWPHIFCWYGNAKPPNKIKLQLQSWNVDLNRTGSSRPDFLSMPKMWCISYQSQLMWELDESVGVNRRPFNSIGVKISIESQNCFNKKLIKSWVWWPTCHHALT